MTFLDTADVHGDGRSEVLIGRFLRERGTAGLTVATKTGRRAEQVPENYSRANFRAWNDRSRAELGVDTLDLVQLHCPPTPVYDRDEVYDALDELVAEQRITAYGVSVETAAEALTAITRPGGGERADHPERVPAEAAGAGAAGRGRGGRGDHRAGPSRVRPALRPLHRGHRVRPRRPPQLQPARRAFDVGETLAGCRSRSA
ncbi:Aldo/keto reductase family protein [Pseudonocardia thermophila]|uniref:Aldo/keto reductase family protein n=1 Tax=Pseudonocardia thermophila TaxID=1848 RepID=A0A1M6T4V3_PSETH|nr:Aldo/keto reductase family protein [Pseudonocardia thermophila]